MRQVRRLLSIFLLIFVFSLLFSCAMSTEFRKDDEGGYYPSPSFDPLPSPSGDYYPETGDYVGRVGAEYEGITEEGNSQVTGHQLSASALFDHKNYSAFEELLFKDEQTTGEFSGYQSSFNLKLNRLSLHIENGAGARVELIEKGEVTWASIVDNKDDCYLFSNNKFTDEATIRVTLKDFSQEYTVRDNDTITLETEKQTANVIDLLFVIDTTGSMGDEITYLKAEVSDVVERLSVVDTTVRLGLLFYRDFGDVYVTRMFDFTTDIASQVTNIRAQGASGGGDFEEAVQEAFRTSLQFSWSESSTKVLVHVADAPSHDSDVSDWFKSVNSMSALGIKVLTVASSGIDKKTEFLYRSQAIQTNGCYAFLTNHSGIGGDHLDPTTDEQLPVEYLDDLLVRVISGFHTGVMEEPTNIYPTQPVEPKPEPEPIVIEEPIGE